MLNRFKIILKGILLYLILIIVTLFKDYKIISIIKVLFLILVVMKWSKYIKRENRIIYFQKSIICISIYWICLIVNLFIETKVNAVFFVTLSVLVWIIALALGFQAGKEFLTVINKYDPSIMKEYYDSHDFANKVEKLEIKLHKIKETSPIKVVEVIEKRDMIKPIAIFHAEMIILSLIMLWPLYLY